MPLYAVKGAEAIALQRTSLAKEHLLEPQHLEKWVTSHPEILGEGVLVITTQFDRWATSGGESAAERPDVLGLDSSGQLVVVELKRDGDRKVHLQAITYAALVSNFTKQQLAQAHGAYLRKSGSDVSDEQALDRLKDHVEDEWDPDVLSQPRIVLVAEKFPPQVLTSARWLTEISGGALVVECHEIGLYRLDDSLYADFRQIWPVADLEDRMLLPRLEEAQETQAKVAERKRRARTAHILHDAGVIPDGARITLRLDTWISSERVAEVQAWIDEEPERGEVTWTPDPNKPLVWRKKPDESWSLSRLAKRIVALATDGSDPVSMPGGDVWTYGGEPLADLARRVDGSDVL